jgi:hypothetical protein
MNRIYGSRDNVDLGLWWARGHGAARPLQGSGDRRDSLGGERERSLLGFSPMALVGGEAAEMVTRRHSTEAADCAPMERWFRTRGG